MKLTTYAVVLLVAIGFGLGSWHSMSAQDPKPEDPKTEAPKTEARSRSPKPKPPTPTPGPQR